MEWHMNSPDLKLSNEEVAQEILQIYIDSLQDPFKLRSILSEYSILDYFGKSFYGQEDVCYNLIANLHCSSFELSSLATDDKELTINWDSVCEIKAYEVEKELGVSLMSTPTSSFPGLAFYTPMRINSSYKRNLRNFPAKRGLLDFSFDHYFGVKKFKFDFEYNSHSFGEGPPGGDKAMELSSKIFQSQTPNDMRFLSSFGTICYNKRVLPSLDPKKNKHGIGTLRDRFCHLYIGFQCDDDYINVNNCKIWIIKYGISSKMAPRNLLKSFNESDYY